MEGPVTSPERRKMVAGMPACIAAATVPGADARRVWSGGGRSGITIA